MVHSGCVPEEEGGRGEEGKAEDIGLVQSGSLVVLRAVGERLQVWESEGVGSRKGRTLAQRGKRRWQWLSLVVPRVCLERRRQFLRLHWVH
jgi:hypothetical protein